MLSRAIAERLCAMVLRQRTISVGLILTDSVTTSNLIKELASSSTPTHEVQESTYLLEKLAGNAQHHTAEMLRLATSEQGSEWRVAANVTRRTNTVVDYASFELDLIIFSVVTTKSG